MRKDIRNIFIRNGFHSRIILMILYFEKKFFIKLPFKILRKFINQASYHCEIHPDSFIDVQAIASLRLPHPFLISIHRTCRISMNCTIFQGVTIGVIDSKEIVAAQLANNVYIGCNSSILGPVSITDDVTIGAHSLVLKSVNESGTILGLYK